MRCFVVGNGPSLKQTPLDELCGEMTFGVNKVFKIFDRTNWRPTHYVRAEQYYDPKTIEDEIGRIMQIGCNCYLNHGFKYHWRQNFAREHKKTKVEFFKNCFEHTPLTYEAEGAPDGWHLPEICGFGGSIPVALQIAVKEGFDPIYLVGCDLDFIDGGDNHFCDDYEEKQLRPAHVLNGNLRRSHEIAAKSSPVPIYNATLGGSLEAYPRVALDSVLKE